MTSASSHRQKTSVIVSFGGGTRSFSYYEYVSDPKISEVKPGIEAENSPYPDVRGIESGGVSLHVIGSNLDNVQAPQMVVYANATSFSSVSRKAIY